MYFFGVSSQLAFEERRVGRVADRQKHAVGLQLLGLRRTVLSSITPVTPCLSLPSTSPSS